MSRDIVSVPWCISNEGWSTHFRGSKGDLYFISFEPHWGWSCTCPGFTHHRKECKHIREVKPLKCTWGENAVVNQPDAWKMPDNGLCPRCGLKATYVKIML